MESVNNNEKVRVNVIRAIRLLKQGFIKRMIQMDDRSLSLAYSKARTEEKLAELYEEFYRENASLDENDLMNEATNVICINDNFGMNSFIKKYSKCKKYDTIVSNGTHANYCKNLLPENLVDNYLESIPDLSEYDTVIIDNTGLSKENREALTSLVLDTHSVLFLDIYDKESWCSATAYNKTPSQLNEYIEIALSDEVEE